MTITNGGSGLSSPDFPAPFLANEGSGSSCATIENIDIVFPNPGKNVHYGGSYASATPQSGAGIVGSGCSGNAGSPGAGYLAPAPSSATAAPTTTSPAGGAGVGVGVGADIGVPSSASTASTSPASSNAQPTGAVTPPPTNGSGSESGSGSGSGSKGGKCTRRRKRTVLSPRAHQEIIATRKETKKALEEVMKRECTKLFNSSSEVTVAQEQECLGYGVISKGYMEGVRSHIQSRGRVAALRAEYPAYHH